MRRYTVKRCLSFGFGKEGRNMSTINLLLNHYIGNDLNPSRQISFFITEECVKDYLAATEDERTVEEFLETYDSDESAVIYEYATDDGRIISERITYCDDFEKKYKEIMQYSQTFSKEEYYWNIYTS